MKSQRIIVQWMLVLIFAFAFVLSPVSAQEENPSTPTPVEPSFTPEATPEFEATPTPTSTEEADNPFFVPPPFEMGGQEEAFQLFSAEPEPNAGNNLLAGGDAVQSSPALAYNPINREYLVVWVDDTDSSSLRGRFISEYGTPATEEFVIASGIIAKPKRPEIVFNSTDNTYMLVWCEPNGSTLGGSSFSLAGHNLYAMQLGTDGLPVSASPTQITNQLTFYLSNDVRLGFALAYNSNANEFLLAWEQPPTIVVGGVNHPHRVMGQRLGPDAALRGSRVTIKIGIVSSVALAFSPVNNEYLVTWDRWINTSSGYDLFATRLRSDTLAQTGTDIALATGSGWQGYSALAYASSTNQYFITWMHGSTPPAGGALVSDILGRLVQAGSGALVGQPITILADPNSIYQNDTAYSPVEDRFLVVGKINFSDLTGRYVNATGEMPEEAFQITTLSLDIGPGQFDDAPRIAARSGATEEGIPNWVTTWKTDNDIYGQVLPKVRLPLIFLPGLTGSRIYVPQEFTWNQPNGHGGIYENIYSADDEIWINPFKLFTSDSNDDYFDILRIDKDGVTQSTALYGVDLEARDILGDVSGLVDVYDEFLAHLESAGYQLGVDLFIFPYDWRMDISQTSQLLDDRVLEVLGIFNETADQSQWKITQVDMVAHSMGASVAREYISYPVQAGRVRHLIAVGPAFLGAPKPLKGILFGDKLDIPGLINAEEVKDIVQNMPGVFQVSPRNAYWEFYDGSAGNLVLFQEEYDFDGDNQELGDLSYDQYKTLLFSLDRDPNLDWDGYGKDINQTVFNMGETFHNRLDFSWDSGIPISSIDLIVGTGKCSIGQFQSTWRVKIGPPGPVVQRDPIVKIYDVNGDGTVPLFSSSLYDPDRGIDHRGGANLYYVSEEYSEHAFMLSKEPIRELILNLLKGDTTLPDEGIIQEADVPEKCKGTRVDIESPVELRITDAAGNQTGWTTLFEIEENIPGSQYDEIDDAKSIYLPDDGQYTIFLKATDSGSFNLILHLYKNDGTENTIVYLRAPLTTTTIGNMLFDTTLAQLPLLNLDHDGDGAIDEIIEATSFLNSTESADNNPPHIEIISPDQSQQVVGSVHAEWVTQDSLSGVLNEWGYIDIGTENEQLVANDETTILLPGEHTLSIFAEDRLGNASQEQVSFTVSTATTTADFYLHGTGANSNPATLFLDNMPSITLAPKYKDTASLKFSGGNLWKDFGTWAASPSLSIGNLNDLNQLELWLGLKNSDDQGTNFDLRAEIYKNNILVGYAESLCITGITRNPDLAKQVVLPFNSLLPTTFFNGTTDTLALKIKARIGTNGSGAMCGGHSNAVGLRLYFDGTTRPSGFDGEFMQ